MIKEKEEVIREWHTQGLKVVSDYARCEYELVCLLMKMQVSKGYLLYKAESLRQYAICVLLLPENAATDMVTVARKCIEVPEMLEALRLRRASISKLRKVCPVITSRDAKGWLDLVHECSTRVVEKAVAMAKPEEAMTEQVSYKNGTHLELKISVSEALLQKMNRLKDLQSQKSSRNVRLAEALEIIIDKELEKIDPVKKAERALSKMNSCNSRLQQEKDEQNKSKQLKNASVTLIEKSSEIRQEKLIEECVEPRFETPVQKTMKKAVRDTRFKVDAGTYADLSRDESRGRISVTARTKHIVNFRDQAQCCYVSEDGMRCSNRRWLHFHHVQPVAQGGADTADNLETLCWAHHRLHHFQESRRSDHDGVKCANG